MKAREIDRVAEWGRDFFSAERLEILVLLAKRGSATYADIAAERGGGRTQAVAHLNKLKAQGYVSSSKSGKTITWTLKHPILIPPFVDQFFASLKPRKPTR